MVLIIVINHSTVTIEGKNKIKQFKYSSSMGKK